MSRIICLAVFILGAISDFKTKTIPVILPVFGIVAGGFLLLISENKSELIAGTLFGLVMLVISAVINDFGTGDGLMIVVLGLLRGISICMEGLLIAFVLTFIWGMIISIVKRSKKKIFLPFMPFFLIALIAVEITRAVTIF